MASSADPQNVPPSPEGSQSGPQANAPGDSSAISASDEVDERPDPVRLGILAAVLLVLVSVLAWQKTHPPPPKFYTQLPGIDLRGLTPAQREEVLRITNSTPCNCGMDSCHYSIAECRNAQGTSCETSLKLAAQIVLRVTGKPAVLTGTERSPNTGQTAPMKGMCGPMGTGGPSASPEMSPASHTSSTPAPRPAMTSSGTPGVGRHP